MKTMPWTKTRKVQEMAAEYRLDYKKAKPNRFAARMKDEPLVVMTLDEKGSYWKTERG